MPLNDLYCHQQICIPPTFPYLLRQYAKAAIRSQPTDLLKWSTAYFRCLALNVPPPVKPRLEYPIPRDYLGITPGWLKALNYQLHNCKTVNYRILWDRWFGSCLDHNNLLQILCLGGFNDPDKIPWNKFIGICVGFLNDNLTQTMIMFCEIMTEEPEGGSAMITVEMFLEVYKFLAMIDASQPQILPNLYFTDEYLGLEMKEKKKKKKKRKTESSISSETVEGSYEMLPEEEEAVESLKGEGSVISCPDIVTDDILKERDADLADLDEPLFIPTQKESTDHLSDEAMTYEEVSEPMTGEESAGKAAPEEEGEQKPEDEKKEDEEKKEEGEDHKDEESKRDDQEHEDKPKEEHEDEDHEEGKEPSEHKPDHDDDDHDHDHDHDHDEHKEPSEHVEDKGDVEDGGGVTEDVSGVGSVDASKSAKSAKLGSKKEDLTTEGGSIVSGVSGSGEHLDYDDMDELERALKLEYGEVKDQQGKVEELLPEEEEERKIEEVAVPAVPGIGPKVPDQLVEAVERYLKRVSSCEHGMTMPRHIRHYCCPPLEVLEEHQDQEEVEAVEAVEAVEEKGD